MRSHNGYMADIDEILARLRIAQELGGYSSERAWLREAGVTPSYIAAIRGRGGAKGTGQVKDVKRENMVKLAKTAGVDLGWLLGEGAREPVRFAANASTVPVQSRPSMVPSNFDAAFNAFEWPDGITATQADEVRRRAQSEVTDSTRTLPVGFWSKRLRDIASEVCSDRSRVQAKRNRAGGE